MKRGVLILVGVAAAIVLSGCYHGDDSGGGGDGGYAEADEGAADGLPTAMRATQEDRWIASTSNGLSGAHGHA